MLYFSHIADSPVTDSSEKKIGRLYDILIKPETGEYTSLDFLVIKPVDKKEPIYVPYGYVENLSREDISLKNLFEKVLVLDREPEGYISLRSNILDQQIVDVAGARVVRVNDLRLGEFEEEMCVLGIDVSNRGLLRRLGLLWLDFFNITKAKLIDWRQSQPVKGYLKLNIVSKDLNRLHPADLANIVEDLNLKNGSRLVKSLDAKSAAKVFEEINPHLQKVLVKYLGPEQAGKILAQMSPDEVADLMQSLTKTEAELYLDALKDGEARKVEKLINYPDNTAGGMMSVDYVSVGPEFTVEQTVEQIKKLSPQLRSLLYVYVVDSENRFLGVVSMRWMVISSPEKKIKELLKNYPLASTLHVSQSIEEIMKVMTKYNLFTAAVLDDGRKLLGVVNIDDVMRHLVPHA